MDKKVDFCLTPRIETTRFSRNNSSSSYTSTPYVKSHHNKSTLPEFKLDEELTTNLVRSNLTANFTSNTTAGLSIRDRSLYPQQSQQNQLERVCTEFDLLKSKHLNQKCECIIELAEEKVEKKMKMSIDFLRKKQNVISELKNELEKKLLLIELMEKSEVILSYLNNALPESQHELDDKLVRFQRILIKSLNVFKVINVKNGDCING